MTTRKVIVQLSEDLIGLEAKNSAKNQFLVLSTEWPVDDIVAKACECWKIDAEEHQDYCLIFDDTKSYLSEGKVV